MAMTAKTAIIVTFNSLFEMQMRRVGVHHVIYCASLSILYLRC